MPYSASISVFCGARPRNHPGFEIAATALGTMLAAQNWRLVYGAGDAGMVGTVVRATTDAGGDTLGVIPAELVGQVRQHDDHHSVVITETMHERKKLMFMNSDAIVLLPGGAGSLVVLFEMLTWRQRGLHQKPIMLLNTNGYWGPFLQLIDHVIANDFADDTLRGFVMPLGDVDQVRAALRAALSATHE